MSTVLKYSPPTVSASSSLAALRQSLKTLSHSHADLKLIDMIVSAHHDSQMADVDMKVKSYLVHGTLLYKPSRSSLVHSPHIFSSH